MSKTLVSDIIVPTEFEQYAIERTAAVNAFARSGIVEHSPEFDALAGRGGREINMPFWKDLEGGRQLLSDGVPPSVNRIAAGQDVARIHNDGNAWSVNQLAGLLAGEDPLNAILDLVGGFWARVDQGTIIASLQGMFASESMATNLHSIASETVAGAGEGTRVNGLTFVDATQKLGDRGDRLTAIAVHSATEAALRRQDLIDFVPDSDGKSRIKLFQGRRVIVDDTLPARDGTTDGKVYTSYLFGAGAFAKGSARLEDQPVDGGFGTQGVELSRDALHGDSILVNRRRYILHPRGVRYAAAVGSMSPSNDELATGANWTRVWEPKNVRIVAVVHNN
jgi:hypothetical protein